MLSSDSAALSQRHFNTNVKGDSTIRLNVLFHLSTILKERPPIFNGLISLITDFERIKRGKCSESIGELRLPKFKA